MPTVQFMLVIGVHRIVGWFRSPDTMVNSKKSFGDLLQLATNTLKCSKIGVKRLPTISVFIAVHVNDFGKVTHSGRTKVYLRRLLRSILKCSNFQTTFIKHTDREKTGREVHVTSGGVKP